MNGSAMKIMRCVLSTVAGIRMLESSWELTYRTISTTSTPPVALSVRSGMKRNWAEPGCTCSQTWFAASAIGCRRSRA